jgi:hypothetical protein
LKLVLFLFHRFLSPWWRRREVPPKCRFLQDSHGVTSQTEDTILHRCFDDWKNVEYICIEDSNTCVMKYEACRWDKINLTLLLLYRSKVSLWTRLFTVVILWDTPGWIIFRQTSVTRQWVFEYICTSTDKHDYRDMVKRDVPSPVVVR